MIRLKKFSSFCISFSNEQLFEERERFCKASLLFLYYYIILILFHVLMYMYSTVRGVCMHADSKINFTSASLIKRCSAHPL